jgi:hypothetical protein
MRTFYSFNGFQEAALTKLRELGIWHWGFEILGRLHSRISEFY